MNEIYFIKLDHDSLPDNYIYLLELISIRKKELIEKYRFDIDKKISLLSDLFVRNIACSLLNISNKELIFVNNKYGKPMLASSCICFNFNIAHTRNAIVVGFSDKEIGVDVEKINKCNFDMVNRFFRNDERNYILSDNIKTDYYFYEIWTKKEAYIKWLGKGLSKSLQSFSVIGMNNLIKSVVLSDYVISVCSELNLTKNSSDVTNFGININQLSEQQIVENILDNQLLY